MSIFPWKKSRKSNKPKSPLMLEVEEISTKIELLLAQSAARSSSPPAGDTQPQTRPQTHHEPFEPFEPFSQTEQEGAGGNGL